MQAQAGRQILTGRETCRRKRDVRADPQICRVSCKAIKVGKITDLQYLLTGRGMYRQTCMRDIHKLRKRSGRQTCFPIGREMCNCAGKESRSADMQRDLHILYCR
jgi:hypothetical protein